MLPANPLSLNLLRKVGKRRKGPGDLSGAHIDIFMELYENEYTAILKKRFLFHKSALNADIMFNEFTVVEVEEIINKFLNTSCGLDHCLFAF